MISWKFFGEFFKNAFFFFSLLTSLFIHFSLFVLVQTLTSFACFFSLVAKKSVEIDSSSSTSSSSSEEEVRPRRKAATQEPVDDTLVPLWWDHIIPKLRDVVPDLLDRPYTLKAFKVDILFRFPNFQFPLSREQEEQAVNFAIDYAADPPAASPHLLTVPKVGRSSGALASSAPQLPCLVVAPLPLLVVLFLPHIPAPHPQVLLLHLFRREDPTHPIWSEPYCFFVTPHNRLRRRGASASQPPFRALAQRPRQREARKASEECGGFGGFGECLRRLFKVQSGGCEEGEEIQEEPRPVGFIFFIFIVRCIIIFRVLILIRCLTCQAKANHAVV
jgi:hypothetical protein